MFVSRGWDVNARPDLGRAVDTACGEHGAFRMTCKRSHCFLVCCKRMRLFGVDEVPPVHLPVFRAAEHEGAITRKAAFYLVIQHAMSKIAEPTTSTSTRVRLATAHTIINVFITHRCTSVPLAFSISRIEPSKHPARTKRMSGDCATDTTGTIAARTTTSANLLMRRSRRHVALI